jgi:hypothetical protein
VKLEPRIAGTDLEETTASNARRWFLLGKSQIACEKVACVVQIFD